MEQGPGERKEVGSVRTRCSAHRRAGSGLISRRGVVWVPGELPPWRGWGVPFPRLTRRRLPAAAARRAPALPRPGAAGLDGGRLVVFRVLPEPLAPAPGQASPWLGPRGWVSCLPLGEVTQGEQVLGARCGEDGENGAGSLGLSVLGERPVAPAWTEALGHVQACGRAETPFPSASEFGV